jgi:hypothetical protein
MGEMGRDMAASKWNEKSEIEQMIFSVLNNCMNCGLPFELWQFWKRRISARYGDVTDTGGISGGVHKVGRRGN